MGDHSLKKKIGVHLKPQKGVKSQRVPPLCTSQTAILLNYTESNLMPSEGAPQASRGRWELESKDLGEAKLGKAVCLLGEGGSSDLNLPPLIL